MTCKFQKICIKLRNHLGKISAPILTYIKIDMKNARSETYLQD